jgi:urea transport system permease protein
MEILLLQIFNGLSVGSILLLVALGLAFSFGLMNVINMAHGELIMVGAYVTYVMQNTFVDLFGSAGTTYYILVALPVAFLFAAGLGVVLERLLIRRLYGRPLDTLLATWGVALILQQAARSIFGAPNVQVVAPTWLRGGVTVIDGVTLPYARLFIICIAALCLFGVYLYLFRTSRGRTIRAVMQDRQMAGALGVRTPAVDVTTFALASGLAGVAGCALCLIGPIGPSIGTFYIVDAFLVVVLGGVGQILGTVVAAFGIGVFTAGIEYETSTSVAKVIVFGLVILFLQWRPSGIIARRGR